MPNRAEYLAIWIGITKVGTIVSLLNTNLVGASLAHCIRIASPQHIIVDADYVDVIARTQKDLPAGAKVWVHGNHAGCSPRIDLEVEKYSGQELSNDELRSVTLDDSALYIYTSGTTGLPKAAKISHYRIMQWAYWFAAIMGTQRSDRLYDCLPMYHSVGGVVAPGAVLLNGGAVVIREKFSASRFWQEICDWNCTIFQYIGELCRYLIQTPPHTCETSHRLRLCCGNGLRPDVWEKFKERFRIPHILEFYASTEGNVALYNLEEKTGAIGRRPMFLGPRFPVAVIRLDSESHAPFRNEAGLCVRCTIDESGEAIGQIDNNRTNPQSFDGYADEAETQKKVLRDVFRRGDSWFRTGDLMYTDRQGYFYFVDRIGDTFRWKGENVSTAEVEETILNCPGVVEAAVYGVAVPSADGRAGMAALVIKKGFGLHYFAQSMQARLPSYAVPRFLRICKALEVTSTFKHKKADLSRQGYDPKLVDDVLHVWDATRLAYLRLDDELYSRIVKGIFAV
jgi:fatty-acyl-CoA synthase